MKRRKEMFKILLISIILFSCLCSTTFAENNSIRGVEGYTWYRGCVPTTMSMIYNYWGKNGYPNLYVAPTSFHWDGPGFWIIDWLINKPYVPKNLADEFADLYGFPESGGSESDYGTTSPANNNAIVQVAQNHGYKFSFEYDESHNYDTFKNEIDNSRPVFIAWELDNDPSKGHASAGTGYDFNSTHKIAIYNTFDTNSHVLTLENETILYWGMVIPQTPIDLVFLIDTTGSMWDDIAAAKAAAVDIVNSIDSQTNDYRIAVVDFEDFPYDPYGDAGCGDYMYHNVLNFSSDKSAIVSAIQGLPIRCGNDWQEAHYSALMHVLQKSAVGGWRDNVKKVVIVMTDAPPHDPEPYTGYTLNDVKNAAMALDPAVIYPIVIGGDSTTTAYMESLAEGTGGKVFDAENSGDVVEAIMSAIEVALQSPTAETGGPYSGITGSPITFDASGSYDLDGTIVLYEWDWNNDGTYDTSTTFPTTTHSWSIKYSGTVRLRVTDNDGLTGIDTATVQIIVTGDLDGDGDVDNDDLKILNSYLNKPASSCPACDLNGDSKITVLDSRKLVLLCTRPRCATK